MKVLVVDDERNIRESIQRFLELEGIESVTAEDGRRAAALLGEEAFDAVVLDLRMPGMDGQELLEWMRSEGVRSPAIMISALGDIKDAVAAMKAGAFDYLIKPFDPAELVMKLRTAAAAHARTDLVEAGSRTATGASRLVGESAPMRALAALIDKVAPLDSTVLVTGESGTGKELVAREIHARSKASAEPFVALNMGGMPENLVESELFGHEKGAFTGAEARKPGLFELAGSGTIFLDEIGDTPLPLQVKLLRVIQERKARRLGGTRDVPIAARLVSATNRDIEALVHDGKFREDLYYRLNVVRIAVPSLRERREDIPLLAGFLMGKICSRMGKAPLRVSPEAMDALVDYDYPGNVRELENLLERAAISSSGGALEFADLDMPRPGAREGRGDAYGGGRASQKAEEQRTAEKPAARSDAAGRGSLGELEREAIVRALEKWGGNRTKAAAELAISRRTIINKIRRYGIV
ncbi:MAG TPA: sigma-54 dependent transcriptional regulator [Rectinemataceae bacterium]|nr:sigma-54 dependent transcriptional regulator [Rectinemataceae bacterium]